MKIQKDWGVEEELPEEIIEKILLKMAIKELIRCSAVCKSWNSLIKNPRFIQTHFKNQTDDDNSEPLLLLSSFESDDLHRDDPAALFGHYSNLLNPIHNHNKSNPTNRLSYRVVGTCNGLVCICSYRDPCLPVILWNPSIRKFRFLPSPSRSSRRSRTTDCDWNENYFFGYDSRINDYKVVRIVKESYLGPTVEVEVWSLARGGAWKRLQNNVPAGFAPHLYDHACVKGAFHWVQGHETNQAEEEKEFVFLIVAWDVVDESFRNVEIRQAKRKCKPFISRYHGDGDQCRLALFEDLGYSSFDLWVMMEYGVAESWTKLFNICLLASPREGHYIRPFGFTKSGQVVGIFNDGTLKSYDPKDKQLKDFGNPEYVYLFMDSFVESLVLLGQTNVFSY
ncbi:hypothetical protein M0R45_005341 [Rubus argutus]|uniref:F-box domain-containing protein n=1 Tax=Rubus argutus TaxID=59490 RepID=A0AAW1YM54_RUBAR